MQDLNDLYYFVQVVEHHGFAPAGRALDVPKSKLSRRVAALEERLGVRLVQRSTRKFSVTELGQNYYQHCKAMLVEAEAAQEVIDLTRAEPRGVVRVACAVTLLHFRVGTMLAQFMADHPRVQVHLEATNRRVDVIQEGFDLALRVRFPPIEDSDLVMKVLGESSQCLVASPELLKQHAPLHAPVDLHGVPSLDLGRPQREHVWQLDGPAGAAVVMPHTPRLVTDDMIALRLAALAGIGIVQLPTMTIREEFRSGALVRVLPDWVPRPGVIHAVFPSRRGLLPAVRKLIDFLAERFEQLPE
jgi:DNA-binding transcriptional LysR family regulator